MIRALYTAASGMEAQQLNLDTITNNMANANTVGYKKSRAEFEDLMYQTIVDPGTMSSDETQIPTGIQIGLGVKLSDVAKIFTQGDLIQGKDGSNGQFPDLAIVGPGFFKIQLPGGAVAYTRAGNFQLDGQGFVVTPNGYKLFPPIQITDPQTIRSISVSENGKVYIERKVGNNYSLEEVGQIFLYKFINPAGLKSIGNNLFVESPASGPAIEGTPGNDGFGKIIQGKLERANVNIVEEMVNLIVAQRAYEMNSKGVQASDEMLREAATLKR